VIERVAIETVVAFDDDPTRYGQWVLEPWAWLTSASWT
jgi:hypothetical protein